MLLGNIGPHTNSPYIIIPCLHTGWSECLSKCQNATVLATYSTSTCSLIMETVMLSISIRNPNSFWTDGLFDDKFAHFIKAIFYSLVFAFLDPVLPAMFSQLFSLYLKHFRKKFYFAPIQWTKDFSLLLGSWSPHWVTSSSINELFRALMLNEQF